MNDAPIKQPDGTTESRPAELSEPHFDDIAVLIAKPVEPITQPQRNWFAWLERPRMMIGILVVAGLLGTTALALTLQVSRRSQVDSAEIRADELQAQPESPLGSIAEQLKSTAPRMKNRKARTAETSGDAQPIARRVGVIYGSSSDRP